MMTVDKLTVAVGDQRAAMAAARYPLEGDAQAMWLGSAQALAQLGLKRGAQVHAEELALALQGQHAVTAEQVRRPGFVPLLDAEGKPVIDADGSPCRQAVVNSFRLAFSVPKSVSVAWSQAAPELRAEIEQATVVAANAAVEQLVKTRPVVGGERPADGFAASAALHVTARTARGERVPSPQLHVHMDVVGVLDGETLKTPNSQAFYKDSAMREAGAVGRASLAASLEQLGFGIEARTGRGGRYFEIAGVPRGLCERMSGRSREVEAWIKEREAATGGRLSNREAARAALLTRAAAEELTPELTQAIWDAHAREFELGPEAVEELRAGPAPRRDVAQLREEVRAAIVERIWAEGPTVPIGAVRSMAFELAPLGLTLEQASEVVGQMQAAGELVALKGRRVTAREIRDRERYVARVANDAAHRPGRRLSRQAVERGVQAAERDLDGHALDPEQRDAVRRLTGGAGWACLTGRAGTGKGPVLQAVAEAHRADGWTVIACALDGATTQRLGHQVGAQAVTIEQLLHRLQADALRVDDRTLILIDEASKVGLRHWTALAHVAETTGARIMPVGDVGQIGAIEAPGMLDVMLADTAIPTARLSKVRRHRDPRDRGRSHPWLIEYQAALYERRAGEAIGVLRREQAITMHATRPDAMEGLVDAWERRRREEGIDARDAVLIVYGANEDVDEVNRLAQARRIDAGEVKGPGVQAVDRDYRIHEHDVVMLREAAYRPEPGAQGAASARVENGTMGIVVQVDRESDRLWVAFDEPGGGSRVVMVDQARLRAERAASEDPEPRVAALRLAYAGHPFPMQGATFDYVGSLWGHWSQGKEETYSGDTRAKCWLDVHIDRESTGRDGTDDDRYARHAKRLEKPTHRLASIALDATPGVEIMGTVEPAEAVPELPARAAAPGVECPASELNVRRAAIDPDPFEAHRGLLGPARLRVIGERADALAAEVAGLDDDGLSAVREQGRRALGALDRPAAREAGRLERDELVLAGQIETDRELAAELEAKADGLRGLRARRARADLLQAAAARRHAAEHDERALARLVEDELALRSAGRHPDGWLEAHGEPFARGIAAERELALRYEREPGDAPDAERALDEPMPERALHEPAPEELLEPPVEAEMEI